jgi:hypothetical protein
MDCFQIDGRQIADALVCNELQEKADITLVSSGGVV